MNTDAIITEALSRPTPITPATFAAAKRIGGTQGGSILAHPADKGTGVLVLGYDPELTESQDLGIEIAVADTSATVASTGAIEAGVLDALNLLPGYRAERVGEGVAIETDAATTFDPDAAAAIIAAWLRRKHGVEQCAVRFIFGPPGGRSVVLRDLRGQAYAIHAARRAGD